MKKYRLLLAIIFFSLILPSVRLLAQDTTWVQTFTFDSTWTRRAKFFFPTANQHYRKILMFYDLKCYSTVSGDNNYACGQWDESCYQTVYDHRGRLDSTLLKQHRFSVYNTTPDSLLYTSTAPYDLFEHYQYHTVITNTTSLDSFQVGNGNIQQSLPFNLPDTMQHSQFIWKGSELSAAGLTAGNISGIRLQFANSSGFINDLVIRIRQVGTDSIVSPVFMVDSLTTVFDYQKTISTSGWNDIQFTTPFNWDGTSNLLIDFSYRNHGAQSDNPVLGTNMTYPAGIYTMGASYCTGNELYGTGFLDFGLSMNLFPLSSPRTYEFWADIDSNGTLFSSGGINQTYADYSLVSDGGNNWRIISWDKDIPCTTGNVQSGWKHYAITYDGNTIKMYQDGMLTATIQSPRIFTLAPSVSDFLIGGYHNNNNKNLSGKISNFRIWDKAIGQDTLAEWMNKYVDPSHPDYAHLKADYHLNEGSGNATDFSALHQPPGMFTNNFDWQHVSATNLYFNASTINWRPNIVFEQGSYSSYTDSVLVIDTVYQQPTFVTLYDNPGSTHILNDTSSSLPNISTGRKMVWNNGWSYTYLDGVAIDSTPVTLDSVLYNDSVTWYSNTVAYEMGRAITPYGIQLNMGNGKTWAYDVTDYYNVLQDTVDLLSGGYWELEDVRFAFIKGEPPATVVRISQPWGQNNISTTFRRLAMDSDLTPVTLTLEPQTKEVRIRTRITGHGSKTSNPGGAYPHCCEFWDNTHYLYSNNQQIASFSIFNDCGLQPLYPQGGTWNTPREGWCPGDIVHDVSFNLTPYVSNGILNVDYGINPVPANNPGMGDGHYLMAMQLIEYTQPGRVNDAEMYNIVSPTNFFPTSRMNPVCNNPQVVLRNAGSAPLTSAVIKYSVSGGSEETYTWTGNLAFMDTTLVTLPLSSTDFWGGDGSNVFMARIDGANNTTDEYAGNDTIRSSFTLPDNYDMDQIVVAFKTNASPSDNTLTVRDFNGNTVLSRVSSSLLANHLYLDTLTLPLGCYTLTLDDANEDGLSFWANPGQGTGYLQLKKATSALVLKTFNADFGAQIYYPFSMGYQLKIHNTNLSQNVQLYPNPNNGKFGLHIAGYTGSINVQIVNMLGQVMMTDVLTGYGSDIEKEYNDMNLAKGVYFVNLYNENARSVIKMVVE